MHPHLCSPSWDSCSFLVVFTFKDLENSEEMKEHDVYEVCLTRDELQDEIDTVNTIVHREIAQAKCMCVCVVHVLYDIVCIYACMYVCTNASTYTMSVLYVCTYVFMPSCMKGCMGVCMCTYMHIHSLIMHIV